ncbi:hypothetical protein KUTeg_018367 [Tegillarca granosa]|uniref:Uncharacterized protein n=1 Tax=Tegillarca granosa TaxID=220873 RepID=A0ABQ9EJ44_TEGGR|nr:hypothetical protein KUTeg_018367 [Tegillarca granosa]
MFTNHQSARQTLGKKVFIPGPSKSAKDFAVSFQFNSRQENNVRQTISGFGDLGHLKEISKLIIENIKSSGYGFGIILYQLSNIF